MVELEEQAEREVWWASRVDGRETTEENILAAYEGWRDYRGTEWCTSFAVLDDDAIAVFGITFAERRMLLHLLIWWRNRHKVPPKKELEKTGREGEKAWSKLRLAYGYE